jgi:hypothetical protein
VQDGCLVTGFDRPRQLSLVRPGSGAVPINLLAAPINRRGRQGTTFLLISLKRGRFVMRRVRWCAPVLLGFCTALISPVILIYSMPLAIGAAIDLMQLGAAFVMRAF